MDESVPASDVATDIHFADNLSGGEAQVGASRMNDASASTPSRVTVFGGSGGSGMFGQFLRVFGICTAVRTPTFELRGARWFLAASGVLVALVGVILAQARGGTESSPSLVGAIVALVAVGHARAVVAAGWVLLREGPTWGRRFVLHSPISEPTSKSLWALVATGEMLLATGGSIPTSWPISVSTLASPWWLLAALVGSGTVHAARFVPRLREFRRERHAAEQAPLWRDLTWLHGRLVANAFCEEWLYRFLQLGALWTLFGPTTAVAVSALAFGGAHYVDGKPGGVRGVSMMTVAGLGFGAFVITTGEIWGGIALHAFLFGGHGAVAWLTRWRAARREVGAVWLFPVSDGDNWLVTDFEGTRLWPLCRARSRLGALLGHGRTRPKGEVQMWPWETCRAMFAPDAGAPPVDWAAAPTGLRHWRRTGGTLISDPARLAGAPHTARVRIELARRGRRALDRAGSGRLPPPQHVAEVVDISSRRSPRTLSPSIGIEA